jgi:hypothetical protein
MCVGGFRGASAYLAKSACILRNLKPALLVCMHMRTERGTEVQMKIRTRT